MATFIRTLLGRGDRVAIEKGRLVIHPKSGKAIPHEWLKENTAPIIDEIIKAMGVAAFRYSGYSTGQYGKHKAGGLTLQFIDRLSTDSPYAVFNADLTRARDTKTGKKGAPLPAGQFRVGKQSSFVKFWTDTGLSLPRRFTSFHDYMGKLEGIVFTGNYSDGERLDKKTIKPVSLDHEQLLQAFSLNLPDNSRTTPGQSPDNSRTRTPDKEPEESHIQQGFQEDSATGVFYYGNKVKGNTGNGSNVIPIPTLINNPTRVEDKTVKEWLDDYGSPD